MRFWEENRSLILAVVSALALTGAAHLAIANRANARAREIRVDLDGLRAKLEKHHQQKFPRLAEAKESFWAEIGNLETTLDDFKRRLDWKFPAWVTRTEAEMSFPIHLLTQIERIGRPAPEGTVAREAAEHGVALNANWLGFKRRGNWTEAEAKRKLKLLAIAENIAVLAYQARVTRVLGITPGDPTETGALRPASKVPYRVFIREYPVTIRMTGTPESIMRFVHSVRPKRRAAAAAGGAAKPESEQFLVIRRLTVRSTEEGLGGTHSSKGIGSAMKDPTKEIYVEIEAAGMVFLKAEEIRSTEIARPQKPTVKPGDIKPLGF